MNRPTKIALFWLFEIGLLVAASWGLIMAAYKLLCIGHVAIGVAAILCHLAVFGFVFALMVWAKQPGELDRRAARDKLGACILGVWLIGTWVVGLKM